MSSLFDIANAVFNPVVASQYSNVYIKYSDSSMRLIGYFPM